jgi:hypothetical protein
VRISENANSTSLLAMEETDALAIGQLLGLSRSGNSKYKMLYNQ